MNDVKQKILEFIASKQDCVVATVNMNGKPEAAVVGFSENEKLELVFGTYDSSRKYKNIQKDPHVAVVFGFEGEVTVQYEGMARLLSEPELTSRLQNHFRKIPDVEQYRNDPGQVYFCISPSWIRYTNYYKEPWEIEEIREFA